MLQKTGDMDNRSIDKVLDEIERKAGMEFEFLLSTGAEFYSTAELLELRGRCKEQQLIFAQLHRVNLLLGASSPVWVAVGFVCGMLGWQTAATISLFLFPFMFLLFVGGSLFLHVRFKGKAYLHEVGRIIECELAWRQDELARKKM